MAERAARIERHQEPLTQPEEDPYPRGLQQLDKDLLRFAKNFPKEIASRRKSGDFFAVPADEMYVVRGDVKRRDVTRLRGYKAFLFALTLFNGLQGDNIKRRLSIKTDAEGDTDVTLCVKWK